MVPQRLSIKFFAKADKAPDLGPFTPLFHRWIQNGTVEGLLVDVADYKHVPDGPGVMLIGHDVDYGIDLAGGKAGLLVVRKRYERQGELAEVLRDTIRKAVLAARAIQADATTGLELSASCIQITLIDRLAAPNTDESFAEARRQIEPLLGELFEEGFDAQRGSTDPRACLSLVVTTKAATDFDALLDRLEARAATA